MRTPSASLGRTATVESPDGERLEIPGLTGVTVGLTIAGPGSRSYAFLIDWQFRVLLALAWFAAVGLSRLLLDWPTARRPFAVFATLPALLIYFFYQPVLEVLMAGRTPGKRMAGVRLVTRSGGTPGIGALLIRNIFRLVDSLPALYLVGLVCCLITPQRVRIGDLAAGTLLVVDEGAADGALTHLGAADGRTSLPPAVIELAQELLQRWPELEPTHRQQLARTLLKRAAPVAEESAASLSDAALRERLERLGGPTP